MSRRLSFVVVVAVGVLLVAGCKTLTANTDTRNALQAAGYHNVSVSNRATSGSSVVTVSASSFDPAQGADQAARTVWNTFPLRFDELSVTVSGSRRSYSHDELLAQFGPRPRNLDARSLSGETTKLGVAVLAVIGIGVLGAIILAVVLTTRARRRRVAAYPPYPPWGSPAWGAPPGWPSPPPTPGWGPPAGAPAGAGWGPPPAPPVPGWPPPPAPPPVPGWPPPSAPPPVPGWPPPSAPPVGSPPIWGPPPAVPPVWGPPPADAPPPDAPPLAADETVDESEPAPPSGWSVPQAKPVPPPRPLPPARPGPDDRPPPAGG